MESFINFLPLEIIDTIFQNLDIISLLMAGSTCAKCYVIVKQIVQKKYPNLNNKNNCDTMVYHVHHGLSSLESGQILVSKSKEILIGLNYYGMYDRNLYNFVKFSDICRYRENDFYIGKSIMSMGNDHIVLSFITDNNNSYKYILVQFREENYTLRSDKNLYDRFLIRDHSRTTVTKVNLYHRPLAIVVSYPYIAVLCLIGVIQLLKFTNNNSSLQEIKKINYPNVLRIEKLVLHLIDYGLLLVKLEDIDGVKKIFI